MRTDCLRGTDTARLPSLSAPFESASLPLRAPWGRSAGRQAPPQRCEREQVAVEVVVDVVVARKARAGVLRLVPGPVQALGLRQPAQPALGGVRAGLAGGVEGKQRPCGL